MDSFLNRVKLDKQFRETLIDSLCHGIKNTSEFREVMYYVIDNKFETIQKQAEQLYQDEDDILLLILPSVRRVWAGVFIQTPKIFEMPKIVTEVRGYIPDKRLELYQLSFDIDDFIDYLITMSKKVKNLLDDFEYLDKTQQTLTLLVDNYIAKLVNYVTTCEDISKEIRDLKIKKMID